MLFKKGLLLYCNFSASQPSDKLLILEQIRELKNSMNTNRTNFELPDTHHILITPYWLLGFIEGDGSFSIINSDGFYLRLVISQVITEKKVMEAIKTFLLELAGSLDPIRVNSNPVQIIERNPPLNYEHRKHTLQLSVTEQLFLKRVLIPFFDKLNFLSKKGLDYQDWKTILELKTQGWQFTPEGADLILSLSQRMNNNRLSSNGKSLSISDNILLDGKVEDILSRPSNLEVLPNGKVYIKSQNVCLNSGRNVKIEVYDKEDLLLYTFDSTRMAAEFFNKSIVTIRNRLDSGKPLTINDKDFFLKRVINPLIST